MNQIIVISGKARHGKDSSQKILEKKFKKDGKTIQSFAFGDRLKQMACEMLVKGCKRNFNMAVFFENSELSLDFFPKNFGISIELRRIIKNLPIDVVGKDFEKVKLEDFYEDGKKEVFRELMQVFGTHMREKYDKNFWINSLEKDLKEFTKNNDNFVVFSTDTRYPNELEFYKNFGKNNNLKTTTIRVVRKGFEIEEGGHISETALDDYIFDEKIISSSLEELEEKIKKIKYE